MKYTFDSLYFKDTEIETLYLGSTIVWKKYIDVPYDDTKIALIRLDDNDEPTNKIAYFDTTEQQVLQYYLRDHPDHNYMLRVGSLCPVTEITINACHGRTNLIKALILNELETIAANAFEDCENLREINLPGSLLIAGSNALDGIGVTSITIPSSLYTIPAGFLANCSDLQEIVIEPGSVEIQSSGAFQYCPRLSSISIPDSIEYIGTDTFQNCTALREILIPNSVTHMLSCFSGCSQDLTVYVDNTCVGTRDGNYGWQRTSYWGLEEFNQLVWLQGMNVFSLGTGNTRSSTGTQYSFSSFSDLANWLRNNTSSSYWVDIGDTVGPITPAGPLPTLVSARFVGRNMTIYGGVFSGYAPNLAVLDTGDYMEQINDSFCNGCSSLANVRIGTAVKSIGHYAFANCTALTSIDIPSNVETIDSEAFSDSSNLTTITINKSEGSITGAPWGATNATVVWTG